MINAPLVSVVVPTHSRPEFLIETLRSITAQSYKNIEVWVVSNGHSEANQKVVEKVNDNRVNYVSQQNTGGPAAPRNRGIQLSRGKYIAFCDDDDIWLEEKLDIQVKALEEHNQYGLCYGKMIRFDDKREWTFSWEEGETNFKLLLINNTVPISSVLMHRTLLEKEGGFCESKKVGISEDYEFLLRLIQSTNFLYINEYLIKYWSGRKRQSAQTQNLSVLFNYFLGIMGCYHEVWKKKKCKFYVYIVPTIFQLKLILKIWLYQIWKNLTALGYKK